MQVSLLQRIRELEADNASLVAAASEAAALAEEYGADAAAYRRGHSVSQEADHALVTELTDAARRKDRRITRLTALLTAEKDASAVLRSRVAELEDIVALGDEMEVTLRMSLDIMRHRASTALAGHDSAAPDRSLALLGKDALVDDIESFLQVADNRVAHTVLQAVSRFFADSDSEAIAVVTGLHVARAGSAAMQVASFVQARLMRVKENADNEAVKEVAGMCTAVYDTAEAGVRWCFEKDGELGHRATRVQDEMGQLEQRVRTLCADVSNVDDVCKWENGYRRMKVEVMQLAVDSLCAALGTIAEKIVRVGDVNELLKWVSESVWRWTEDRQQRVATAAGQDSEVKVEAELLRRRAEAAERSLEIRKREVEEVRVRAEAFEERVGKARAEVESEVAGLRARAESAEKRVAEMVERSERSGEKAGETARRAGTRDDGRRFEQVDTGREARRLRGVLAKRSVRDLEQGGEGSIRAGRGTGRDEQMWRGGCVALGQAREAAANASVVVLERGSLDVRREGRSVCMAEVIRAAAMLGRAGRGGDDVAAGP